eukprot:CAMPEP_0184291586 /NCGR_PEP_ID=MMETSP1049-20130417/3567_1 /TAXON_ID=77928 /ORGANISM="Proteomonas sulcata, Strain CCMP704" /LENGTH=138 /DNA_ID=CAMNT_0026599071 /DNA_START=42 /DNA_END=458 /DNA_ORIENTATION=+
MAMGPGGTFGYAQVDMQGHKACIQIGTHGSLTKAELEEIAQGGPKAWTPGACPARYSKLDYGGPHPLFSLSSKAEESSTNGVPGKLYALAPGGNPGFEGAKGREIGRMPQRHQASALGRQPEKAEEAAFPAVGLGSKS